MERLLQVSIPENSIISLESIQNILSDAIDAEASDTEIVHHFITNFYDTISEKLYEKESEILKEIDNIEAVDAPCLSMEIIHPEL